MRNLKSNAETALILCSGFELVEMGQFGSCRFVQLPSAPQTQYFSFSVVSCASLLLFWGDPHSVPTVRPVVLARGVLQFVGQFQSIMLSL